jgi:hypothetical protein
MCSTLSATLLACGAMTTEPPGSGGGACGTFDKCGDGQVCDRTAAGGAVCISASGDLDGDGIPNGKDFCEHLAGGASDEDGDGIGDDCDACPIAAPGAADADGDAVMAPCDPDTRTPGDKILRFNGFNAAVAGASPAWKFQNGEAIVTAGDAVEQLVVPLAASSNHVAIFTSYQIEASSTTAATARAGVGSRTVLPMGNSEILCGGSRESNADQVLLLQTDANLGQTMSTLPLGTAFNPSTKYRVVQQIDGPATRCAVAGASMSESGAIQLPTDGNTPTQAVLYARGATVRFSYILVVGQ